MIIPYPYIIIPFLLYYPSGIITCVFEYNILFFIANLDVFKYRKNRGTKGELCKKR